MIYSLLGILSMDVKSVKKKTQSVVYMSKLILECLFSADVGIGIFFLAKHSVLGFDFILWCCWVLGVAGYIVFGK